MLNAQRVLLQAKIFMREVSIITIGDELLIGQVVDTNSSWMAQQLNAPVGVLCTSGSAALNYYPAIAEAFYQQVPLIVFTADRPKSWVNQGDGQTIDQDNVFKNHIRYSITIPESTAENFEWVLSRELSTAFHHANANVKGPVHINLPFSEPLYQQAEATVTEADFKIIEVLEPTNSLSNSGAVVSKRIKTFLRNANIAHHWKIGFDFLFMDTYQSMTQSIPVKPSEFIHQVTHFKRESDSTFGSRWKQKDFLIQEKANHFFPKSFKDAPK